MSQFRRFDSANEQAASIKEFLSSVPGKTVDYSENTIFYINKTPCYFDKYHGHTLKFEGKLLIKLFQ